MVSINEIIKKYAKEKAIPLQKVARSMGISKQALYLMLKSNDLKTFRLTQISHALNHNFFQYYITPSANPASDPIHLQQEIDRLTTKLAHLQEVNTYQQEIINLLKAKSQ